MLTLICKIRKFLTVGSRGSATSGRFADPAAALVIDERVEPNISASHTPRPPGTGRRSNRDRKSKAFQYPDRAQCGNHLEMDETLAIEKAALEHDIRVNVEILPQSIRHSYLTLLDALLTHTESDAQIERIKALHTTVLDAKRHSSSRPT